MSVLLAGASIVWIALAPSWQAFVYGGFLLVSLGAVWLNIWAARGIRRGAPTEIVATRIGLSSATWSLDWDRVSAMWIGSTPNGQRAILIEPYRPADIRRPGSTTLAISATINRAFAALLTPKAPETITLLQANVDRPLEQLLGELEAKSGRSFIAPLSEGVSSAVFGDEPRAS
jgi:hypothetical protein